jgi:hypothetical protein
MRNDLLVEVMRSRTRYFELKQRAASGRTDLDAALSQYNKAVEAYTNFVMRGGSPKAPPPIQTGEREKER